MISARFLEPDPLERVLGPRNDRKRPKLELQFLFLGSIATKSNGGVRAPGILETRECPGPRGTRDSASGILESRVYLGLRTPLKHHYSFIKTILKALIRCCQDYVRFY